MKAKELADLLANYPDFDVKMRYVDDNKFIDANVMNLTRPKYSNKEIVFYIDR